MSNLVNMRAMLERYREFAECIVEDVVWKDFGTTVVVGFDYIWEPDGSVRADNLEPRIVNVAFRLVQEITVRNNLPSAVIDAPTELGWGLNEVSRLTVARDSAAEAYDRGSTLFYRATFRRENGPWIDIVFAVMEVWPQPVAT